MLVKHTYNEVRNNMSKYSHGIDASGCPIWIWRYLDMTVYGKYSDDMAAWILTVNINKPKKGERKR